MSKRLSALFVLLPSLAYAGGSIGGGSPGLQDNVSKMSEVSFDLLPKVYAEPEAIRRATIRLGESGVTTTDLIVDGETIQVQKIDGSIVDEQVSKEILPK